MTVDGRQDVFTRPNGVSLAPVATFSPLLARTQVAHAPVDPIAFDCLKFIVVRAGRARLFSEFGVHFVSMGDVVILAANTLCGAEPEGWISTTTLYLDRDYVIDQVFWQYASRFHERLDASQFLDAHYAEPTQVVRIGRHKAGLMMPWLDELVALSVDGLPPDRFYRAQSLVSAVFDILVPFIVVANEGTAGARRSVSAPTVPRHRQFRPVRPEVLEVAQVLRAELDRHWTVTELAARAHLSVSQLRRVFVEAFGKSPISYLTMLRAERMAHLLRVDNAPISEIAAQVGWGDPDFAALQFRRSVGVSPSEYRRISEVVPAPFNPE
ncbi:AraC family transcriptional regulator [Yimella lutea]|uniref:AraC family transcriptional regulator n=1 Tax=Yimella lutea TaxID=587872 RepID=UPI00114E52CB|nr:AraC family transcriptional regulator [Yimella lutea]